MNMTVEQLLPVFEKLFKAGAINHIIIRVCKPVHLFHDIVDDEYLLSTYVFDFSNFSTNYLYEMRRVFKMCLSFTCIALMKSPLNNRMLSAFVKIPSDYTFEYPNSDRGLIPMPIDSVFEAIYHSGIRYNQSTTNEKLDSAHVKFFINDSDIQRVDAIIKFKFGDTHKINRMDFIDTITLAIPELDREAHKATYFTMYLVSPTEFHVRYAFNNFTGKFLPDETGKEAELEFIANFVKPYFDGFKETSYSEFFIKPNEWEKLIPEK